MFIKSLEQDIFAQHIFGKRPECIFFIPGHRAGVSISKNVVPFWKKVAADN